MRNEKYQILIGNRFNKDVRIRLDILRRNAPIIVRNTYINVNEHDIYVGIYARTRLNLDLSSI